LHAVIGFQKMAVVCCIGFLLPFLSSEGQLPVVLAALLKWRTKCKTHKDTDNFLALEGHPAKHPN
jgi:hypothetical protein